MGAPTVTCVGVDGCPMGWIAAIDADATIVIRQFVDLDELVMAVPSDAVIAIDMPIGLPERIGQKGRGPERLVRPLLGDRQSSVFAIPARAAVMAEDYRQACAIASATSEPPRKVAKQAFNIFPKIRRLDALLLADAGLAARVFEVHPEVAFWRLNGERALHLPKKVKSRPYLPGLELRRQILASHGIPLAFSQQPAPRGAGQDDLLDALACLAIARRITAGSARSYPDPPDHDAHGLPIAIWA